jgi:hypothetical protein
MHRGSAASVRGASAPSGGGFNIQAAANPETIPTKMIFLRSDLFIVPSFFLGFSIIIIGSEFFSFYIINRTFRKSESFSA